MGTLFPLASNPKNMAADWYVQDANGEVRGPLSEREVGQQLLNADISDSQQVRQGDHGPWCAAPRARLIFQRLAEEGWYVREGTSEFGPFTGNKLLELYRAQEIASSATVRQGTQGNWRPAQDLLAKWGNLPPEQENVPGLEGQKWSVAPIRHVAWRLRDAANLSQCFPYEHLCLEDAGGEIRVHRDNGDPVGGLEQGDELLVRFHLERGIRHLVFVPDPQQFQVTAVCCPPGVDAATCLEYVDTHFRQLNRPSTDSGSPAEHADP